MNTSKRIFGSMLGLFEDDYERETTIVSAVTSAAIQIVTGNESTSKSKSELKTESNGRDKKESFSKGTLEGFQKQRTEKDRIRSFNQTLKEGLDKVQMEKDRVFEEEINDIITNLPTEQKNRLLHYQASYKDRSIYQRAELRKKLIEEQEKAEKEQKNASITSPAKQPSAIEGAFEGRSGTQGSGQSNLSAQAVG